MRTEFGSERNWPAQLSLQFAARAGRSVLSNLRFKGPLRVQRVFHPEPEHPGRFALPAHCYILHPPGGMVSGDELSIAVTAEAGVHALVTTPASGKIYRADTCGVPQWQDVRLQARDAVIEWLPQETIVFSGAKARLSLDVALWGNSRFIGWESLILGRSAGAHPFIEGAVRQTMRLSRNGAPALSDRLAFRADDILASGQFGLGGRSVFMNFWAIGTTDDDATLKAACEEVKDLFETAAPGRSGATFRGGVLIARYLGDDGSEAAALGKMAWQTVRPYLLGRESHPPRIWSL